MKGGLELTVGKTIAGVFAASRNGPPTLRAYLFFTDGTSLEFYGNDFNCAGSLDRQSTWVTLQHAEEWGCEITNLCLPPAPPGQA